LTKQRAVVVIDPERCKGCDLCVVFCPEDVLELGHETNSKGYRIAVLERDGCTGCEICGKICPDQAIAVYRAARAAPTR
jgi:2-oxoglutarate ferredoxin oxidoreductase subunit delta